MPKVSADYYENKKKEIIEAAYRVCARKPVTSVVMKDVIAETGFSHGVVYRYYKDLDEVLCDLVITINSENKVGDKLNSILSEVKFKEWQEVIREICDMMAEQLKTTDMDVLKISLYCDMLAISDHERASRIAARIGEDNQSPLLAVETSMYGLLVNVTQTENLKPIKSIDEIIEYMIATYHGIQTSYVLAESYDDRQISGKYDPGKMFSCMAEAIILMMGCKSEQQQIKDAKNG